MLTTGVRPLPEVT